jgi:dolichol-phosphate mannosyltransferase
MSTVRHRLTVMTTLAQAVAALVVLARLGRGRTRPVPLAPGAPDTGATVSVVVPARDEEDRLAGCLAPLRGEPGVTELVVVDDGSTDATAAVAAAHGARVVAGAPLPGGWAGKPWALEQGVRATSGEWIVFLDADARPRRGLVRALVEAAGPHDVLTVAPRFTGERVVHASLLATLTYRFGPPPPRRRMANGQCLVVRRATFVGWAAVRGHLTEDVALARRVGRLGFADAADLLTVEAYRSPRETLRGWSRSILAADSLPAREVAADLATLWLTMGLPQLRLLARRTTRLDRLLLAVRLGLVAGLRRSYDGPIWPSPLADLPVLARLTVAAVRPDRSWRGRTYPADGGGRGRTRR